MTTQNESTQKGGLPMEIPANTHGVFSSSGSSIGVLDTSGNNINWALSTSFPPNGNMTLTLTAGEQSQSNTNYTSGNPAGTATRKLPSVSGTWYGTTSSSGVPLYLNIDSPVSKVVWVWIGSQNRVPVGTYALQKDQAPPATGPYMVGIDTLTPV